MVVELVAAELDRVHERIAGRFGRAEPRARVREYLCGLVAALERKNGWTLAEHAGAVSPDGMQRLLRRADWDVDGVRDDVRAYVVEHLGDKDGVLIADDTGFLKKGTRSAGVQRQYSGTAGRTENCQVGVLLAYASRYGHALIDRDLYLPQSWTDDPERCRAAGIPQNVEFTTKPRQAQAMIARAVAAGVPFAWFTADETYGQAKWLQAWLEERDIWYVMAIRCSDTLTGPEGEQRADALIAAVPPRAWQKISAGAGAHGPREYHWARIPVRPGWKRGRGHWLLARRSLADPQEIAYYACYGPRRSGTADLAWTAGSRWHVARSLPGPQLACLVRPHHLVHAGPGLAGRQQGPGRKKGAGTSDPGMIGYTLAELRRLLISLIQARAPDPEAVWSWSRWRRRRQYQARLCHYRRRGYALTTLHGP
jgi:DDE superfamily endonuclease